MKISVIPYDPAWLARYESEAAQIRQQVGIPEIKIEHIGSTSVPGLAAKPIIDILIGLPSGADLDSCTQLLLEDEDYFYIRFWESVMPFRRFLIGFKDEAEIDAARIIDDKSVFQLPVESRRCHIHMVHEDHSFFDEHVRFRDILRANEDVRKQYQHLKLNLAEQEWENSADYAKAKADYISSVLRSFE